MHYYASKIMTTSEVQSLYERRPYPHYPLLAKPRWQDGYLGSSRFARALTFQGNHPSTPANFLSVGCGEILPYILRKWESRATTLSCVDLSQRSLNRAKFRCATTIGTTKFFQADINQLLLSPKFKQMKFEHIEAFGVIHHIPNLDRTVELLAKHLTDNGTMRIMVYNSKARDWIWDLNRSFRLLGLRHDRDQDIASARHLLYELAKHSPRLAQHLKSMGPTGLANDTRFADTFMHPWEARLTIKRWLDLFAGKSLEPYALYDRYAELDDLANPLWTMPTKSELTERAQDYRFENNLEIWLRKPSQGSARTEDLRSVPISLQTRLPPTQWTKFPETSDLGFRLTYGLWRGWQKFIFGHHDDACIKIIRSLARPTAQRLARIGAILPSQAEEAGRFDELRKPMTSKVSPPELLAGINSDALASIVPKNLDNPLKEQVLRRWSRI